MVGILFNIMIIEKKNNNELFEPLFYLAMDLET
jgi:hypothetical protein